MKKTLENNALRSTLTTGTDGQGSVNVPAPNLDAFVERLNLLVKHFGGMAEIARRCGFSESTVRNWVGGVSDPSRARCMQLAQGTGSSLLWVVAGEGPMWAKDAEQAQPAEPSQDLSAEHLTIALELADEALRGLWLPRSGYAELVALVYDALTQGLPYAEIFDIARPAAKQRAGEVVGDDGDQAVGQTDPEGAGRSAAG